MDSTRRSLNKRTPARILPLWMRVALCLIPAGFIGLFFAWPLTTLIARVVNSQAIEDTLTRSGLGRIVLFTFTQALLSTIATLVIGIGPAYLMARWEFPSRRILLALITVPFMLPTVVVGSAFLALLPASLHNTAVAIVVVHVFFNIAVVVRVVGTLWAQIPRDLSGAARTLGASSLRSWRDVTLPLLMPGIMAASAITFLFTFTSFGVIQIIGGPSNPTIEVEIARRAIQLGDVGGAAVLAILQALILLVVIIFSSRWARRTTHQLNANNVTRMRPRNNRQRVGVYLGAITLALVVITPLAVLIRSSFRVGNNWSLYAWTHLRATELRPGLGTGVDPLSSIATSFRYAILATLIAVSIGTLGALAISSAQHRGKFLDSGIMLPLGTSAVTIGFGMLITFSRSPFNWRGSEWLIPVGHALVAIPFVVRSVLPVLRARPATWLDAAATLGASRLRAFKEIDLARLTRPIQTAAAFAAAISLGEFGATTFLTRSGNESMPIAIGRLLARTGDIPRAQAFMLASILAIVTAIIVVGIEMRDA